MPDASKPGTGRAGGLIELARFGRNPLDYLDAMRGDTRPIIPFRIGTVRCNLVTDPELVRTVLEDDAWPPFARGRLTALDRWFSGGLFTIDGEEHDRQRDRLWPALVTPSPTLEIAVEQAERRAASWREGEEVELSGEMRSLCWSIDWQALTGSDLESSPELLTAQLRGFKAVAWLTTPFGEARWDSPLPSSVRARAARRRLDAAIDRLIAERRARGDADSPGDGLGRLLQAAGGDFDDEVLRANVKLRLSSDQLHGLLAWTLSLLARHPDVAARWHAELDEVVGDRLPAQADLGSLPYARKVLYEALRVYPPIWAFFRALTGDYELGGTVVPSGELIVLSPWFTQRDPRFWTDPLRFDPERWNDGVERPPGRAFFPFSAGSYGCQAHDLVPVQAMLMLATIGRRWSFRLPGGWVPKAVATRTIEIAPQSGLWMAPLRRG